MDLIFNELSLYHKAQSKFTAQELIKQLLLMCKDANKLNFNRLKVSEHFTQLQISEGYTINDWLNDDSIKREYKTLLLGLKRYPFIDKNDENIENRFIQNYYYLNMPEISGLHRQEPEGLSVAFLYNTISISFLTNRIWEKTAIELFEKTNNKEDVVSVKHISCIEHLETHREWIETNRPVTLIKTEILSKNKAIKLRDDHGKDVLKKFAKKLTNLPYIVEIINSLPFNPKETDFIKQIYPDGKIEIVLTQTEAGFGLIVQTTGRNLQETKAIADIIQENYS